MEVDRNMENFSVLTAARIKIKSTDISTVPHIRSFAVCNNSISIQLIPLLTVEAPVTHTTSKAVVYSSPHIGEVLAPQPVLQRPQPVRTFQKHYIRLHKRVASPKAPPRILSAQREASAPLSSSSRNVSSSAPDGQQQHITKPLTSSPKYTKQPSKMSGNIYPTKARTSSTHYSALPSTLSKSPLAKFQSPTTKFTTPVSTHSQNPLLSPSPEGTSAYVLPSTLSLAMGFEWSPKSPPPPSPQLIDLNSPRNHNKNILSLSSLSPFAGPNSEQRLAMA